MIRRTYPRMAIAKTRVLPGVFPVPVHFRINHPFRYPPDNQVEFERWYYELYTEADCRERLYLPVFWTAYQCKNKFGKDPRAMSALQQFVNTLDRSKKYYTICQYDDGPLVDFGDLDIIVFGMAGGRNDFPIPLLCQPHKYDKTHDRDIFCSFVGRITHPIRSEMIKQLQGKTGYYISTKEHKMDEYCSILARSKYALCPRGYSATSFRIAEAIHYGAVPVYVSDTFIIPYNYPALDYGYCYHPATDLPINHFIERMHIDQYSQKAIALSENKHLFTYSGCKQIILQELKK